MGRRCLGLLLQLVGRQAMPKHVAFIMDGNRRYANGQHIDKLDGHALGYTKASSPAGILFLCEHAFVDHGLFFFYPDGRSYPLVPGAGCALHQRVCFLHRQLPALAWWSGGAHAAGRTEVLGACAGVWSEFALRCLSCADASMAQFLAFHLYAQLPRLLHMSVNLCRLLYRRCLPMRLYNNKRGICFLTHTYLSLLKQDEGLAEQKGVKICIVGDLDLAPSSVRGAAARLMKHTAAIRNQQAVLNICFAYTWEISSFHGFCVQTSVSPKRCVLLAWTFSLSRHMYLNSTNFLLTTSQVYRREFACCRHPTACTACGLHKSRRRNTRTARKELARPSKSLWSRELWWGSVSCICYVNRTRQACTMHLGLAYSIECSLFTPFDMFLDAKKAYTISLTVLHYEWVSRCAK